MGTSKSEQNIRNEYGHKVIDLADELAVYCIRAKVPMFLSLAYKDEDSGELKYDNRIVSAALEMPGYAKRINKLIMAVNDCSLKLPEHIQRAVEELENWLNNEGDYSSEDITVNKFRDFLDVANGQVEATIPSDISSSDIEEIEITTKKSK